MEILDINSLNVQEYYKKHKSVFEVWREGEPIKAWYDAEDILCIQYESENWWHYRINNKQLEWW